MQVIDCLDRSDPDNDHFLMRFSPGGTRLAVATEEDDWVVVLDVPSGSLVHRFTGQRRLSGLLFLSEDRILLFGGKGPSLHDLATHGQKVRWKGEALHGSNGWTGPQPGLIVLGGRGLSLYDLANGQYLRRFPTVLDGDVTCAAFSLDGRHVAADSFRDLDFRLIQVWDVHRGRLFRLFPVALGQGEAAGVAFSPDGRLLAVSVGSGVSLYGWEDLDPVVYHNLGISITRGLRFSPSGRSLELVSFDGEMTRVDPDSGRVLRRVPPPEGYEVYACAVSEQGLAAGVAGSSVLLCPLPEWAETGAGTG
jgi:WD40 repeat protein